MSQVVTHAVALTLKKGDILYHNIIEFGLVEGEKTPAMARVTGPCKDHHYEGFALPIKRLYGAEGNGFITRVTQDMWRTTPEKVVARVSRTRHSATVQEQQEAPDVEPETVTRVRRTRTTVTGRVVDDEAVLLQNAQDQLTSLRVKRTRR